MRVHPPQTIALFGATGTAGRATAKAMRDAGHAVVSLGRSDPTLAGVTFRKVDVCDRAAVAQALRAVTADTVVSCLASRSGTPADAWAVDHAANLTVLHAAKAADTGHFVLLSALCVQKPRLAFQHAKLAFEEALITSGLTYSIVRPTAFFKSLSGQLDRLRAGKPYLMFGHGALTACKPISDADLGAFMASCLTDQSRQNALLPIGGPGPALTPREMGQMLFDALGMPAKFRAVSPKVITTIASLLALGGKLSPTLATKAELARIGHYYATESMLLWHPQQGRYDATATPSFGNDTLADFYAALAAGQIRIERGDHAVF